MQNVSHSVLLAATLAVYLSLDTVVILQTGKTPGLFHKYLRHSQRFGPITREGRPRLYRNYVFGNVTVLMLCIVYVVWALFSPENLNRTIHW